MIPIKLLLTQAWLLPIALSAGLLVGSFLNVVLYRLPIMRMNRIMRRNGARVPKYNLAWPPSACVQCHHQIRWYQNIPVVSWVLLRGRCAECGVKISIQYPLVELGTGIAFCLAALIWLNINGYP